MTAEEQERFLETQPFGVLATIGPNGDPHQVTLGFALDGPRVVYLSSFRDAQKVVNARRTPRASFLVERTSPYSQICGVMLSGAIEVVEEPGEVMRCFRAMQQRSDRLLDAQLPSMNEETVLSKRVVLVLSVERSVSWDHGKLHGVY